MPLVLVPEPYRGPTQGLGEISVEARDVRGALLEVETAYPGFASLVLDAGGEVHRFVKLFVNEEQINSGALETTLSEGDRLGVLAAIAGG
ncbi:MAG: MoaD/ThiS family protein [Myxococcota bacterium]|nr:MoaD/ThiS family protein [Myxococcota bacterium]